MSSVRSEPPGFSLRPLSRGDLDDLVALDADPEVMRFISGGSPTPREVYVDVVLPRWLGQAGDGLGFFVIEVGGAFSGWAHLRRDAKEPSYAEIGYRVPRRLWGRGLATAVATHLQQRAWDLGFRVTCARAASANLASRRVMEKIGMSLAGMFEFPAVDLGAMRLPAMPAVLYTRVNDDGATVPLRPGS